MRKTLLIVIGISAVALVLAMIAPRETAAPHDASPVPPAQEQSANNGEVTVYFANWEGNPSASCDVVFPVKRTVVASDSVPEMAGNAMRELIAGPSEAEKAAGYTSALLSGTVLKSVAIDSGAAYVDFTALPIAGSCAVGAVRAQIEMTMRQFPGVERVTVMLNGSADEALQP